MAARGAKHRTPWLVTDSGSIRVARAAQARSNAHVAISLRIMHHSHFTHRRRVLALPWLLACHAAIVQAATAAAPVLTVTGAGLGPPAQAGRMAFDLGALQQLDQRKIVSATPWYSNISEFTGPLLRDVLKASGAGANVNGSGRLRCTALNDYRVEIPLDDVHRFDVVVAHLFNGKPMSVREKGPLFVIYPFDEQPQLRTTTYFSRCIWQLKSIELL
jgi:hypothetical protein